MSYRHHIKRIGVLKQHVARAGAPPHGAFAVTFAQLVSWLLSALLIQRPSVCELLQHAHTIAATFLRTFNLVMNSCLRILQQATAIQHMHNERSASAESYLMQASCQVM